MKHLVLLLCSAVLFAPAATLAADSLAVGPYTVTPDLRQMGSQLWFNAQVSGGSDCEKIILNITADNTNTPGAVSMTTTSPFRYSASIGTRLDRTEKTVQQDGLAVFHWYIADASIQCINGGAAKRYRLND